MLFILGIADLRIVREQKGNGTSGVWLALVLSCRSSAHHTVRAPRSVEHAGQVMSSNLSAARCTQRRWNHRDPSAEMVVGLGLLIVIDSSDDVGLRISQHTRVSKFIPTVLAHFDITLFMIK